MNILQIYIIKQDIRIYVPYSRPNGWTEWAKIFCGHSWVAGGCYRLKNQNFFFPKFFFQHFFFHGQRQALQLVLNKTKLYNKVYNPFKNQKHQQMLSIFCRVFYVGPPSVASPLTAVYIHSVQKKFFSESYLKLYVFP